MDVDTKQIHISTKFTVNLVDEHILEEGHDFENYSNKRLRDNST